MTKNFVVAIFFFFDTRSHCAAQAALELASLLPQPDYGYSSKLLEKFGALAGWGGGIYELRQRPVLCSFLVGCS